MFQASSHPTTDRCWTSWCAGLFDADGGFSASLVMHPKSRGYPYLQFQAVIDIREEVVADIFCQLFGGSKRAKRNRPNGHSPMFVWKVSRKKAAEFAEKLGPYLVLKNEQAKLLLKMHGVRPKTTKPITHEEHLKMKQLVQDMHNLNKKGVGKVYTDLQRKLIPGENKPGFMVEDDQ